MRKGWHSPPAGESKQTHQDCQSTYRDRATRGSGQGQVPARSVAGRRQTQPKQLLNVFYSARIEGFSRELGLLGLNCLMMIKWTLIFAVVGGLVGAMVLCSLPVDTHGPGYWSQLAGGALYFALAGGGFGVLVDLLRLVFRPSDDSGASQPGD